MSCLSIYDTWRIYVLTFHLVVWRMTALLDVLKIKQWGLEKAPFSQDCLQVKKTQKPWQNFVLQKRNLRWIEFYSALLVPWWRSIVLTKMLFDICCWNNRTCLVFWCHLGIMPQQHEQPVHWACRVWQLWLVFERPMFPKRFHPLSTESKRLGGQNFLILN